MKSNLVRWIVIVTANLPFAAAAPTSSNVAARAKFGPDYTRPKQVLYTLENPYSSSKYDLGRVLFFDQRLSKNRNQSCASCHHAGLGWEMGIPKALGAAEMPRKSQTLLNLAWGDTWFWDGRADTFRAQFHVALTSPKALALTMDELVRRIQDIKGYEPLFAKAFPGAPISEDTIGAALEIFERGIVSGPAPFDRWLEGDDAALDAEARAGAALFLGKARCVACHGGWNFTDNGFHDIGIGDGDLGRGKILNIPALQHAFKTPTLRSIAQRAPYMHDGSLADLPAVIDHYNHGALGLRPSVAPELKPLSLDAEEKRQLVEFLKSLTGDDRPVTVPQMPM